MPHIITLAHGKHAMFSLMIILVSLVVNFECQQLPTINARIGGNLNPLTDYSSTLVFIDALRTCRGYGQADAPWNSLPAQQYGEGGWPIGYSAGTVVFTSIPEGVANGTYYFQGDGQLTVELVASPDCSLSNFAYSAATGKTTGNIIVGKAAFQLMLSFTQSTNTIIRNLRLIRPGFTIQDADTKVFLPSFLNEIKDLTILRMMDWCHANDNPITKWSERTKTTDATYSSDKGAPYEVMIQLANFLDKEIWVNIPAMVDEDYITQMAKLFKQQLKSTGVVYVEYSNEIWNSGFSQTGYNVDLANSLVLSNNLTILDFDKVNNIYTWAFRRTGYMAYRISELFAKEFGESARNVQFRVVLAGQGANPYILYQGIALIDSFFGPPSKFLYAIASAPYFQIDNNYSGVMSVEDVLNELRNQLNKSPSIYEYATYACFSKFYALKHIAYEGGPDTFGIYNIATKRLAQFDPRMKQIVIDYLTNWFSFGFSDFLWFTIGYGGYDSQYGTWSWAESSLDTIHPKKDGIYYMINNPSVSLNSTIFRTSTLTAKSILTIPAIKHQLAGSNPFTYLASPSVNSTFYYPIIIMKRGYYSISVETQAMKLNAYLGIYWDNIKLGSVLCGSKAFNFSIPLKTGIIEKGLSVVTLWVETDRGFNINTVNVTFVEEVSQPTPIGSTPIPTQSTGNNRTLNISESSPISFSWVLMVCLLSSALLVSTFGY